MGHGYNGFDEAGALSAGDLLQFLIGDLAVLLIAEGSLFKVKYSLSK